MSLDSCPSAITMSSSILYIPKRRHPELIGKRGQNLKDLQSKYKVRISVPGRDEGSNEVVVSGDPRDVEEVRKDIENALRIQTDQPVQVWKLEINPEDFRILIGKQGNTLHGLQDDFQVSINVPRQEASDQRVTIEGPEANLQDLVSEIQNKLRIEVLNQTKLSAPGRPQAKQPAKSPQQAQKAPPKGEKSPPKDGKSPAPTPASEAAHAVQVKPPPSAQTGPINKVIFFPEKDSKNLPNLHEFLSYLGSAQSTLEICVFTITDDRISREIIRSKAKGVKVRVITDDEQSKAQGSDIDSFRKAGIEVKMDSSPFHMHHKFAVIDKQLLLNGSFNWTHGASTNNCENIMITNNSEFVKSFENHFEEMWADKSKFN